jgi:hypothetical protein
MIPQGPVLGAPLPLLHAASTTTQLGAAVSGVLLVGREREQYPLKSKKGKVEGMKISQGKRAKRAKGKAETEGETKNTMMMRCSILLLGTKKKRRSRTAKSISLLACTLHALRFEFLQHR